MALNLSGAATGIDWEGVIQKILSAERKPIDSLRLRKQDAELKRDAWRDVTTRLRNLQARLTPLKLYGTFSAKSVSVSDTSLLTASASSNAATGTHSVIVGTLALAHRVRSDAQTSDTAALNLAAGTITVGKDSGGNAATIDVTANDTLRSLAEKINNKSATVKASVVTVSSTDYRLVLTAANSGVQYKFGSTDTGDVLDGTSSALTQLGIRTTVGGVDDDGNPSGTANDGFKDANEVDVATDATIIVDGLTINRSSNTITDAIAGVTLNLIQADPAKTLTLAVSQDTQTAVRAVQDFVDQFNSAYTFLKEKTSRDTATKKSEVLQGDVTAAAILSNLRRLVSSQVTGVSGTLRSLSDVGITTGKYGSPDQDKLVFDSSKLIDKLKSSPDEVAELFGAKTINVALNSNGATASAYDAGGNANTAAGYNAADVINDNTTETDFGAPGGGWMDNTVDSFPDYLEIAFPESKTVNRAIIYTTTGNGIRDFDVEYWTGSDWTKLRAFTGVIDSTIRFDFDAISTDKLRIKINDSNDASNKQSRLIEVKVFQKNFGAATRLSDYLDGLLTSQGVLPSQRDSLEKQAVQFQKKIDRLEERLAEKEILLREQFTRTEQSLAALRGQGSRLRAIFGNVSLF